MNIYSSAARELPLLILTDMSRLILIMAVILMTAGCGERKNGKKAAVMGPEETLEAFCRTMSGGEFEEAMSFCDTMTMIGYIERYAQAWNMMAKKDSGATAIAAATLADAEIIVEDISKDGDKRTITYIIAAGEGMKKKKIATVGKVEGVWKVEKITDSL